MGLDISLCADNQEVLEDAQPNFWRLYGLSRTFCNLLSKREAWGRPAELDQLGALTGVDIQPLYEMENYPTDQVVQWELEEAETEEERHQVLQEIDVAKERLRGNIDRVQATIEGLLSRLASYDDLPRRLDPGLQDTLQNAVYFASFLQEADAGPIDYHNFGQDLRTIQRFLALARVHSSHTVYFQVG